MKTVNLTRLVTVVYAVLLLGCSAVPPATIRVEVPVIVPCARALPLRPSYEFATLEPTASDGEIVLALALDWLRGRKYEAELEAAIAGCRS